MYNVEFSVLCHYPSLISKDCISIAVLFLNSDTRECRLRKIKNWRRVQSFNDELDIELVKLQLCGIETEIQEIAKEPKFKLQDYTKFYVNTLKFSGVTTIRTDDFDEFVNESSRQYLLLDYEKNERPSKDEQIKFLKQYLKNNEIEHSNKSINGFFNENVQFDFTVKNYAFKLFRFEGRKESRIIRFVKEWAYDAIKLKDKYRIVFITDIDFEDKEKYKIVFNILKEESYEVINFKDAIKYIQNIN